MIDLDCLLCGKPTWDEVVDFFANGEFHEEHYLVEAIEKHLQTEEQRKKMFDHKLSIEKILNGRTEPKHEKFVNKLFKVWNEKLGIKHFNC